MRAARPSGRQWESLLGRRLGPNCRYLVIDHLGSGYIADVLRVTDESTGATYAAKFYSDTPAARAAADHERDALIALAHARVPTFWDAFEHDGDRVNLMDVVAGPSLRERVDTRGALDQTHAIALGIELCEAFEHFAALGWTYRDLHPRNIHPDTPRGAMLVDFDGVRPPDWPARPSGRIGYRAPELARPGSATVACDVFSVAGCIYFAVVGRDPSTRPGSLAELESAISTPSLVTTLVACRQLNPSRRPSISELRTTLVKAHAAAD